MTTFITDWSSFELVLPIALKYGVGVEIQEFIHPNKLEQPEDLISMVKEKTKGGILLSMHGPFSDLAPASIDPLIKQAARARFSQAYDIAQLMGVKHLIQHTGFIPKTYPIEKWLQNACDFWVDFLQDKAAAGLIHLENVYEDDFNPMKELIDRVNHTLGSDFISANLDIGHVHANSSRDFGEWIRGLGNRIRYVHLHNNGGILDDHWRLDKGDIPIGGVLEMLKTYSPEAAWCVETPVDDIEPSLQWLVSQGYLAKPD